MQSFRKLLCVWHHFLQLPSPLRGYVVQVVSCLLSQLPLLCAKLLFSAACGFAYSTCQQFNNLSALFKKNGTRPVCTPWLLHSDGNQNGIIPANTLQLNPSYFEHIAYIFEGQSYKVGEGEKDFFLIR